MSNFAEGAKDLLAAAGVGVFAASSGWGIFIGKIPIDPATVITIYNSGGLAPNPKWLLDFPSLKILIRGAANGYQAAQAKAVDTKNTLLGLPSQDLNGDRWVSVTQTGDINEMGFDKNNRPMFSLNFSLIIEPATGTNRIPLSA